MTDITADGRTGLDPAPPAETDSVGRWITGTVLHADGSAVSGLLLQAFHRRVGGEQALGNETATNPRGRYTIRYRPPDGLGTVDLFIRAYGDEQAVVAVSPIIIGASGQEVLDLTVTDPAYRGPSEFARVSRLVGPQLDGVALDGLAADDVALLVRTTNLSRQSVTAWIAASRLTGRADVDHESMYGLVRTERTAALPRLLRRSPARLRRSLVDAASSNLISAEAGRGAAATVRRLRRVAVELSLSHRTPGSLGELLATATTASPAQQAGFIRRYADHDGPVRDLWRELREDPGFGPAVVDDLQVSVRLGTLTANHPPLVRALRASGVRHAAQTATLDDAGWRRLLATQVDGRPVGVPAAIRGATEAERRTNYVTLLTERSGRAYPTARVARTLKTLPGWRTSGAAAFLDRNPDFNVLVADIGSCLSDTGVVLEPDWDRATLEADLKIVQRVARVAPRGSEETVVNGLLANGFTSAWSISRKSRAAFRRRTAAAFGDGSTADAVHRNAQFQVARASTAFAAMHPFVGGGLMDAVGTFSTAVQADPTWASLFGSVDYSRCEHCRSIHGPVAYLVDLLTWLDGHDAGGETAFQRLIARRPDLQRIELSCANTMTIMPGVDLVNEILEARVLTGAQAPTATTATSPELLANPEHLNRAAYDDHLARAVSAATLPFDLWGELGRSYFAHLGVRRCDLMEALRRPGPGRVETIDAERLRLSMPQRRILTGAAGHGAWEYWGYRSATPDGVDYKSDLAIVSTLLNRAGIGYDDLLDVLHSRFVNPDGATVSGAENDTDAMTVGPLTDELLGRANRFLRLRRNRGWSLLDLDKVLHTLGGESLDAAALGRLADLDRLLELTGAPLLDAVGWFGPLDTFADRPERDTPVRSRYEQVFLNRAVDPAAEEPTFPLALNPTRDGLANPVAWDGVRTILQAALWVDAAALRLLLDESVDGLPNPDRVVTGPDATLDGLSALYRHVSLVRALGLTVADLLGLIRLVDPNVFDAADTTATVRFVEAVARVRVSGFSFTDLHYLLEHDAQADLRVGVTDESIGQLLVEIRSGLARVATDYAVAADPAGTLTARYLGVLLDAAAVSAVMTALRTNADSTNHAELEAVLVEHVASVLNLDAAALVALDVEPRFAALLDLLVPVLRQSQGDAVVIEQVAGFLGRELDSTQDLLALRVRMPVGGVGLTALAGLRTSPYTDTTTTPIVAADDPEAFAVLRRLHKAGLVLDRLGVDIDAQTWLFDRGVRVGLLDPSTLPITAQPVEPGAWDAWSRLVDLAALATDLPGGEPGLIELLRLLDPVDTTDPTTAEAAFRAALVTRTGWSTADLDVLTPVLAGPFPAGWRDGRALRAVTEAFALLGRLGVPADQASRWATAAIGATQAEELRLVAKSKHDEQRWPAVARALRDPVREAQRTALVAYLIAREDSYADADDLYADLLVDVEIAPCVLTSRIKQAISTVQLFVQRAFLNLEADIELTRDDRDQWEWMKNYRVWEAARKVFLYPENWAEPELRPDKSPLFRQLEASLRQGDLDDAGAERAYTGYLEGLQKIALMEVMGLYHEYEQDAAGVTDILHVVARTRSNPHRYHYRRLVDGRDWSAWEEIDDDIEGDHVILAVRDRRLFLCWPMVTQGATPASDPSQDPASFYEMKLAWLERMNEQWGARKLSTTFITVDDAVWQSAERQVYFRLGTTGQLSIDCLIRQYDLTTRLGTFTLDAATGELGAVSATQARDDVVPLGHLVSRMRFGLDGGAISQEAIDFKKYISIASAGHDSAGLMTSEPEDILVLNPVASDVGAISYAYPHQFFQYTSQRGVFMDDGERTFLVTPEPAVDLDRYSDLDTADPADVGTTQSGSDVFVPREDEPAYVPELPWDKLQEPPILAGERAVAATANGTALAAATLTPEGLQQSQSQLNEVGLSADPMAFPTTHRYRFALFCHLYVGEFMAELRRTGVAGLLDPDPDGSAPTLVRQQSSLPDFFADLYAPTSSVLEPYPVQDIDFQLGGAYAKYDWEIFFHVPMLIAARLSQNQRFAEARRWFHFMFDPGNRSADNDPLRFWKIKPFYRDPDAPIEDFLGLAASAETTPDVEAARAAYDRQIATWLADPFSPHSIAEIRTTAYQKTLVMKYLDNLIAWGDQLFRRDTVESLNEATQLYLLALGLLGERPDALPPRTVPVVTTFEQVRAGLRASVLSNPLVQLENLTARAGARAAPVSPITPAATSWGNLLIPAPQAELPDQPAAPAAFYFCIPPNEKLLSYWDLIDDRLFKIRNCMSIEGVVRQLPLFEPPIDPGLLVRAQAAGIDLSSALADRAAPLPYYRFTAMLHKAYSLNQTVRALGAALLAALEKGDVEALSDLRANQEVAVLEAVREAKTLAIDEARHALAAAQRSRTVVENRRDYYQRLISAGWRPEEDEQKALMERARRKQLTGSVLSTIGGGLAGVPTVVTGASGVAGSPVATATVVSGVALATGFQAGGQALAIDAANLNSEAATAGLTGSFKRRGEEWGHQHAAAELEIAQIGKQIEAAEVRLAVAERDRDNHDRQLGNSRTVREFMEQKYTNTELHQWIAGQVSSLYFSSYQLAYDLAKQAERAYRHELALPTATYIQFGYWDSLRKGLLSAESMQHDLERMDAAYLQNNVREYEITRHVSLALLDPVALLQLQTSGSAEFSVPEALFDLDHPGLYLRRIKSVSVTTPCVTGPYTGVPMRLTLVSSRTRTDPTSTGSYQMETAADDPRFQTHTGAVQSIVTSSAQADSGLFTTDHRDERYLPFEGCGAISDWNLTLTSAVPTFDWKTITDVVIHLRYTAREGGDLLSAAALTSLGTQLAGLPLRRAFSAKAEFPSEWTAFLTPGPQAELTVAVTDQLYPHIAHAAGLTITDLEVAALVKEPAGWQSTAITVTTGTNTQTVTLIGSPARYGGQPTATATYPAGTAPDTWSISIPTDQLGPPTDWLDDLILITTYQIDLPLQPS